MTNTIPDIIESILNKVPNEFPIKSIIDNGDGTATIKVCQTWWALECTSITVNNIKYKVKSIVRDESITVINNPDVPSGTIFILDIPFFINGTPIQVNIERGLLMKGQTIVTPMVYLFEPIKENFNKELDPTQRTTTLRIAVLNNYEPGQFTDDIYDFSIRAMRSLSEKFIETLNKQPAIINSEFTTYTFESFAKYGKIKDKNGSMKNFFDENLSGIEIFLTISLEYQSFCVDLCNI